MASDAWGSEFTTKDIYERASNIALQDSVDVRIRRRWVENISLTGMRCTVED